MIGDGYGKEHSLVHKGTHEVARTYNVRDTRGFLKRAKSNKGIRDEYQGILQECLWF